MTALKSAPPPPVTAQPVTARPATAGSVYRRPVPLARLIAATLVLTVPAAAALVVLVSMAGLGILAAGGAYGAVLLLTALLLKPYLEDVGTVLGWARALAAGRDAPAPPLRRDAFLTDIAAAIVQQRRGLMNRQDDLAALAGWHETLFDNLPDPVVLLDRHRRVTRINTAARTLFGRDIGGRDLAVALRDPTVLEAAEAVLAGEAARDIEVVLADERSFRVRVDHLGASPVETSVALLALNDITAIRRIEQMRADFVANASHELRTPLATLLGFIETLRGPARDDAEARDRFLAIMNEQASRMARLVNDLLSLSSIELNAHDRPTDRVDFRRLVEAGAAALQPLAEAKNMRVVLNLDPAARMVPGKADQLAQVVQNLLDNAVKYGRDGTEVTVALLVTAEGVRLSVTDRGEGIAKEHLPRLTERFYRVDSARSRKLGGTGLGLAIVKHIVNRHRGSFAVESVVGRGSTFSVTLPVG